MFLGRGKNENGMAGWLFQCFQKSVEGRCREHVYLVDDVDLVFAYLWRNTYLFYQLPNVIN